MNGTIVGKAEAGTASAPIRRHKPFGALNQRIVRGSVRGWVAGEAADGASPEVEFLIGTELIGRCTADKPTEQRLRNDDCPVRGFHFLLPEPYRLRHSALHLVARIVGADIELTGSPLLLPQQPDIVGALACLQSPAIEGWALDLLRPARPVVVIAVQDGEIRAMASTQAGLEHVSQQGFSGDFRFRIPILTKGAEELSRVQVFVANTNQKLEWDKQAGIDGSFSSVSSESFKFLLD